MPRGVGRLLELDRGGGRATGAAGETCPRPNAMEVGPRRLAVFPGDGRQRDLAHRPRRRCGPERVAGDLGVPDAVEVRRRRSHSCRPRCTAARCCVIDPRTGERSVLASLDPGLDNLTFVGERLFVLQTSTGEITEIMGGRSDRGRCWAGRVELAAGSDGSAATGPSTSPTERTSTPWALTARCGWPGCCSAPDIPDSYAVSPL